MSIVLLCISIVFTLVFPILAIPLNLFGLIFARGKIRKIYGFLLAFCLAILAYIWKPDSLADLSRHHQQLTVLANYDFSQLGSLIKEHLEPLCYLVMFGVAQTGDNNLLQFVIVLCGYFELFWVLCDLASLKNIRKKLFVLLLVFLIASIQFLNFASNLWFHFAIINIVVGVYMYYFRRTKRLQYLFYIIAPCFHIGTLYMLMPMLLFSNLNVFKKNRLSVAIIVFLASLSLGGIMLALSNFIGEESVVATIFSTKYESYFLNDSQYGGLHTGWNLYLPVVNVVLCLLLALWAYKNKYLEEYSSFVVYLAVCVLATIINAGVFVRYGFLFAVLALPLVAEFYMNERRKKMRLAIAVVLLVLTTIQLSRSFRQMESLGLTNSVKNNIANSVFVIMNRST